MNQDCEDLNHLANEEDTAIAYALADALSKDNVEKFLHLYDEIPASVLPQRLGNIKEMARQVAALTRTSNYRHSPVSSKDLPYYGINQSLQTPQLSLNGPLGSTDPTAFKTPPEGCTPVDHKQFDYGEEALKTLAAESTCNLPLTVLCNETSHLNDSIFVQKDGLSAEKYGKYNDKDGSKIDDDSYHTPPEYQDDDSFVPPDELITSVIHHVSKTSPDISEKGNKGILNCKVELDNMSSQEECEKPDISIEEKLTQSDTDKVNSEMKSLDGSPSIRSNFLQEDDDSGISMVQENDVNHDSKTIFNDKNSRDGKVEHRSNLKVHSENYTQRPGTISEKRNRPSQSESKYSYSNFREAEDSIGWQTRYKRIGRKRNEKDFERRLNFNDTDGYGQIERSSNQDFSRKALREGRNKDKNIRMEKIKSLNKTGEKLTDGHEKGRDNSICGSRKNEDSEINELTSLPVSKRTGRRGGSSPNGVKKMEGRWTKNSFKDNYSETENREELTLRNSPSATMQPNGFSYRDALLKEGAKVSKSKDTSQHQMIPFKADSSTEFDVYSAANYLSSVWTSVNNLYSKDPSKVFIYSDD